MGLSNYAFTLALAHLLTPDVFGVATVVQSFLLFASWMIGAGLPWTAARRLSVLERPREQAAVLRDALLGNLALGTVLSVILLACLAAGLLKLRSQPAAQRWESTPLPRAPCRDSSASSPSPRRTSSRSE
jgi:hypothetical protein